MRSASPLLMASARFPGRNGRTIRLPDAATMPSIAARFRRSEIRLVRARDRGIPSGVVFTNIFGTNDFRPFTQGTPIRHGCRPGHREDTFILDRELKLEPLALIVGVDGQYRITCPHERHERGVSPVPALLSRFRNR